jgi:hypothetical protein
MLFILNERTTEKKVRGMDSKFNSSDEAAGSPWGVFGAQHFR